MTCKHDMRVHNSSEFTLSWWLIRGGFTFLTDLQHFRCVPGMGCASEALQAPGRGGNQSAQLSCSSQVLYF